MCNVASRAYSQRDQSLLNIAHSIARHGPVKLSLDQMCLAIEVAREVCETLDVIPIAASFTASHLHIVVDMSHRTPQESDENLHRGPRTVQGNPKALAARIKSIVGLRLSQQLGTTGNRWFSRGQNIKVVNDERHLSYLVGTYLPRHELVENGVFKCWAPPLRDGAQSRENTLQ